MMASAVVGGVLGTLVFSTIAKAASEMALTRMDLPLLLGTAATDNRRTARAIGFLFHLLLGILFAIAYAEVFAVVGRSSWAAGALLGVLHGIFTSTILVNVLLPIVHPRMATAETAANEIALIEPPGFLMLNYGRNTFLVTLVAHIAYGAVVGWLVRV
jgi:hypothetical protein